MQAPTRNHPPSTLQPFSRLLDPRWAATGVAYIKNVDNYKARSIMFKTQGNLGWARKQVELKFRLPAE